MTKILIEGDIDEKNLIKIGKLLVKMYHGKKEHVNILILEGTENKNKEETIKLLEEIWNVKFK